MMSYGEVWLLFLAFYLYEFQKLSGINRLFTELYHQGKAYFHEARLVRGFGDGPQNWDQVSVRHHSLFDLARSCRQHFPVIPESYFMVLFQNGVNHEQVFSRDLSKFLLLLKVSASHYTFIKQALSSYLLVSAMLLAITIFLRDSSWNFAGMIIAMFLVQFSFSVLMRIRVFYFLRKDFFSENESTAKSSNLFWSMLNRLGDFVASKTSIEKILTDYWHCRSFWHKHYDSPTHSTKEDLEAISEILLKQNTLKQDFSLFHVLQAVVISMVFFLQNFGADFG
ncbi:MAG: hypothetical protein OXC40_03350 [Proteobacteria bacterium]|nr:hypothetical protein [Pseudomonadota bacterium]